MIRSDSTSSNPEPFAFLMGGGEMGSLIRTMDWLKTPLGPVAGWPQSLRTTVSICLASDLPICVIWGPGLVQMYNDAYRVICGDKHPRSMGQNFSECWKEAWPVIGQAHDSALAGDTAFLESQQIFLERHGYVEECFFTFSFSPIRDEAGGVGGLFHPVIEMTTQMLSERRTRTLRDLTAQTSKAKSVSEALSLSAQALAEYPLDLPFTLIYALDPDGDPARLEQTPWPIEEVIRSGSAVQVDEISQQMGPACLGPYAEAPTQALVLPVTPPGAQRPAAVFVAGVSARLRMNEAYRSFYDLLASAVTTAVANARAYDDERRRARALAELDRAKIAFFSNVSHEFRTPLTLMLGPVEDALSAADEPLPPLQRARLEVVYRNGLRLQRLVNSLLDFSRIEAGRVRAAYEPTALADFTADLASNFRSACEKAGLKLRIDCPRLSEPVFVDRLMWEKVVLNLLSNAFKFTFEGEIAVSLRQADRAVELRVRDTGTGVPAEEIPRLFDRFYRVENARGRTHEGSGIGLALVRELVRLHGGSISADSELGQGTTFTVSIPLGSQHLPQDQVGHRTSAAQPSSGANPFVEEALRWLPDADERPAAGAELRSLQDDLTVPSASSQGPDDERPLVLIADDNADMRQYVVRMLGAHYRTLAVPDGERALEAARERTPDLILTDVMMPRLDGFGLLQALRADARTSGLPVIMLSARAGEESRIEGLQEGADDYLVKQFSSRELLARVAALLQMVRMRRESSEAIRASEEQFRALVSASSDVVYRMNADWTEMRQLQGREFIADTREANRSWLQKYIQPCDQERVMATVREAVLMKGVFELEHQVLRIDGTLGWMFSRAIALLDNVGTVVEWLGTASDITARKQAQQALIESEEKYRSLFERMDEGYCVIEMIFDADNRPVDYRFLETNPAFEKHSGLRGVHGRRMREIVPDHDAYWFEIYGRVAVTGEAIRFVNEAMAMDGRWFDVYAFRLGGKESHRVAVLFNDISNRKGSEDALRASEDRSRTILESITDGFFAIDGDWRFTYVNAAGERILGRAQSDLIGKRLWDEYPGAVGSEFERVYRRVACGQGRESFTAYYPDSDRWYEVTAYPAPVGISVYFRDVTDRKLGEQEREQLVARLRVQDQRKDEFLATLAHELRNPLAPIRNGLQIMRLAPGDAQATERIRAMMERQLGQMVHLIDDLLDLSRISRGKIDLRRERIELAKAIQQAIEASRPAIANAGHELLIKFPPGPIHVDADLTRLAQVFSNLLNNAAKFTDPGGRIQLTMQQLGDEAVASIQDNGSGIPTGMLPHVFEMFTQVEGNLERSKGGLGIGLSIVKRLVEMHGGSVQARSEGTGMGSEFVVRLPVALTLAADALADPPAPAYPDTSHRILVVDDNLDAAESLATMLAMMGNETRTAHDGLQALKVAAAFRPDVMFLDIGMPKMNGYEVGRRAREQAWGKDMVLIALTGWGQEEDKRRSMEAGLDLHLVKPVLPAALEKLLASLPSARA